VHNTTAVELQKPRISNDKTRRGEPAPSTLTLHCSAIVLQPSQRWKGITMRKTLLALAAVATLVVSAASPAYAGPRYDYGPGGNPYPRTYPGPGGYPYWSGYVDAPVGEPIPPCHWITQRFWDGHGWRERRVRICG
jgi:hypothetical protein